MRRIVISIIIVSFFLQLFIRQTFADSVSLGISPSITTIKAEQNKTVESTIELENFSEQAVPLMITLKEFTSADSEDGHISFIPNSSDFSALVPHIALLQKGVPIQKFELAPKQKQRIQLHIDIPQGTPSRDFTFSVIFQTDKASVVEPTNESSTSFISEGIATNVLLQINNSDKAQAIIENFSAPSFRQHGPIPFTVKIHNPGKHLIAASGTIYIRNMFGQLIGRLNLTKMNILANTSRYFIDDNILDTATKAPENDNTAYSHSPTISWNQPFLLGPYQATLTLLTGDNDEEYSRTIYFFALPYQAIIIGIVFLLFISYITYRVNRYLSA